MLDCINMTGRELRAWASDERHALTGEKGAVGRLSLERIIRGEHLHSQTFAAKIRAFYRRHSLGRPLFGKPLGASGLSARHIALLNWGHDPTKPTSPLYRADSQWLQRWPDQAAYR